MPLPTLGCGSVGPLSFGRLKLYRVQPFLSLFRPGSNQFPFLFFGKGNAGFRTRFNYLCAKFWRAAIGYGTNESFATTCVFNLLCHFYPPKIISGGQRRRLQPPQLTGHELAGPSATESPPKGNQPNSLCV